MNLRDVEYWIWRWASAIVFFQHVCSVNSVLLDLQGCCGGSGKRPPSAYAAPQKEIRGKWSKILGIVNTELCWIRELTEEICHSKIKCWHNIGNIYHTHDYMNRYMALFTLWQIFSFYFVGHYGPKWWTAHLHSRYLNSAMLKPRCWCG